METNTILPMNKPPRRRGMLIIWVMVALLLVTAVGAAIFFYMQWQRVQGQIKQATETNQLQSGPDEETQKQIENIIKTLREVVLLPEGETPTLVRVTDKEKLTENKEFFQDAENGDIVLVYTQARKAYLFRPSTGKLVNLAPINLTGEARNNIYPSPSASLSPTAGGTE